MEWVAVKATAAEEEEAAVEAGTAVAVASADNRPVRPAGTRGGAARVVATAAAEGAA